MTTHRSAAKSELSVRSVEVALAAIAAGRIVVVIDDVDRENEGDLIMAAQYATESQVAFFVRHTSGVLCVPLEDQRCDELGLPLMVPPELNADPHGTAFTVSVDARAGTTTGISAADRATTIRLLAGGGTVPGDFRRPGHVFPLRARPGGVLTRQGHTEAGVDLCRLAGLAPVGLLAEIVAEDGSMARRTKLLAFARRHDLPVVTIADLVAYRLREDSSLRRLATSRIPVRGKDFTAIAYGSAAESTQHVALSLGTLQGLRAPLVRVHSECITGDVFGSERCDCGDQLTRSIELIADAGVGVLVYLRGHEGRGIGLPSKLRAYELQDHGLDTVDANLAQGLPVDARNYAAAGHILQDLGLDAVRLLTNNPAKGTALRALGIHVVEEVPLPGTVTPVNVRYLRTKKYRLGHQLDLDPPGSPTAMGIS